MLTATIRRDKDSWAWTVEDGQHGNADNIWSAVYQICGPIREKVPEIKVVYGQGSYSIYDVSEVLITNPKTGKWWPTPAEIVRDVYDEGIAWRIFLSDFWGAVQSLGLDPHNNASEQRLDVLPEIYTVFGEAHYRIETNHVRAWILKSDLYTAEPEAETGGKNEQPLH